MIRRSMPSIVLDPGAEESILPGLSRLTLKKPRAKPLDSSHHVYHVGVEQYYNVLLLVNLDT